MYRYFQGSTRNAIPNGLPSRLVDPTLRTFAEKPQFPRIGQGNDPRNELLRVVKQYPSQDEVRTNLLKDVLALDPKNKYDIFTDANRAYALSRASQDLGIPLESIGLSVDPNSNAFRLQGSLKTDATSLNNARSLVGRVASTQAKAGNPFLYDVLKKKQAFFSQPRGSTEIALDGTEGVEAIMAAYEKAEPRGIASSQGNRPILMQADGLDPNIGIPTGSPKNIPPMDIEGMKGANRYVDVSQGLETARTIQYPNIYDRLNNGAQPTVTATIPYSSDIPNSLSDSILSPKVSIETKRPRFIDTGAGITTRSGESISDWQKDLLDTGMADLEDRSFIVRDPSTANQVFTTQRKELGPLMSTYDVALPSAEQYRPTTRIAEPLPTMMVDPSILVNTNTYGKSQGKTPWREYYSDPFVYEDKGLDGEVNRLMKAVNEAPAQLENAYTQQAKSNRMAIDASEKLKMLGQNQSVRMGLMPQGDGVINLAREVRKDRRMAEINVAKANDAIAQLKAAQELMGIEYMVKPKQWDLDVYNGYRRASQNLGGIKNGGYSERPDPDYPYKEAWHWFNAFSDKNRFRQDNNIPVDYDAIEEFKVGQNYRRYLSEQGEYPEVPTIGRRQAKPSLVPTFPKPKPTIGELFGFSAISPEGLLKYRDFE